LAPFGCQENIAESAKEMGQVGQSNLAVMSKRERIVQNVHDLDATTQTRF
jgi:hypothetical protein